MRVQEEFDGNAGIVDETKISQKTASLDSNMLDLTKSELIQLETALYIYEEQSAATFTHNKLLNHFYSLQTIPASGLPTE